MRMSTTVAGCLVAWGVATTSLADGSLTCVSDDRYWRFEVQFSAGITGQIYQDSVATPYGVMTCDHVERNGALRLVCTSDGVLDGGYVAVFEDEMSVGNWVDLYEVTEEGEIYLDGLDCE